MSEPERAADVVPLGSGRYLIVSGSRRELAHAVTAGGATWVFLNGRTHVVRAAAPRRHGGRADDEAALSAPMPATVVRIDVAQGQRVSRGDVLLVLEAMKMELPLTAPRDATVTRVRCQAGELVQPGAPLVDLE